MLGKFHVVDSWDPDGEDVNTENIDSVSKKNSPKDEECKQIVVKILREKIPHIRHRNYRSNIPRNDDRNRSNTQSNSNSSSSPTDGCKKGDSVKDKSENRKTVSEINRNRSDNVKDKNIIGDRDRTKTNCGKINIRSHHEKETHKTDDNNNEKSRSDNGKDKTKSDDNRNKSVTDNNNKDINRHDTHRDKSQQPPNRKEETQISINSKHSLKVHQMEPTENKETPEQPSKEVYIVKKEPTQLINATPLPISETNAESNVDTHLKDSSPQDNAVTKSKDKLQWEYMLKKRGELIREHDEINKERIETEKAREDTEFYTVIRKKRNNISPISFKDGKIIMVSTERSPNLRRKQELSTRGSFSLRRKHKLSRERSHLLRRQRELSRERSPPLRRQHELSRERSHLLRRQHELSRERSPLLRRQHELSRERSPLLRRQHEISRERSPSLRRKRELSRERSLSLTRQRELSRERSLSLTRQRELSRERSLSLTRQHELSRERSLSLTRQRELSRERSLSLTRQHELSRERSLSLTRQHELSRERSLSLTRQHELSRERYLSLRRKPELSRERSPSLQRDHELPREGSPSLQRGHELPRERSPSLQRDHELPRERSPSLQRDHEPIRKISPIRFPTDSSSNAEKDVVQFPIDRKEILTRRYEAFKKKLEWEEVTYMEELRIILNRKRSSSGGRTGSPGWERQVYTKSPRRSPRSGLNDEICATSTGLSRNQNANRCSRASHERIYIPNLILDHSPEPSHRERMRSMSRPLNCGRSDRSRWSRQSYHHASAESHDRKRRRKRSPFLRELERTFAEQKQTEHFWANKTYTAPVVPSNPPYFEANPGMGTAIYPTGMVAPPHFQHSGFPPSGAPMMHPPPHLHPEYPPPPQTYPEQPYPRQPYPRQPYPRQPYPRQPYPRQPYPQQQPLPVTKLPSPPNRVLVPIPTSNQPEHSNYSFPTSPSPSDSGSKASKPPPECANSPAVSKTSPLSCEDNTKKNIPTRSSQVNPVSLRSVVTRVCDENALTSQDYTLQPSNLPYMMDFGVRNSSDFYEPEPQLLNDNYGNFQRSMPSFGNYPTFGNTSAPFFHPNSYADALPFQSESKELYQSYECFRGPRADTLRGTDHFGNRNRNQVSSEKPFSNDVICL